MYALSPSLHTRAPTYTHTHTPKAARMSIPSLQKEAEKLNSLTTHRDDRCSDVYIKSYTRVHTQQNTHSCAYSHTGPPCTHAHTHTRTCTHTFGPLRR